MAELKTWTDLKRQIDEKAEKQGNYNGVLHTSIESLTIDQMISILTRKRSLFDKNVIGTRMTLDECMKRVLYTSFFV